MEISIVILTHNQRDITRNCLTSLGEILNAPDCEVILIDNGSSDATLEMVATDFPRVLSHRLATNRGVAAARNIGMQLASGKKILLLDNDTIASPEAIRGLADFLDLHPEAGLVAPRLTRDGRTQASFKSFPGLPAKFMAWWRKSRESDFIDNAPSGEIEPFYVIGAAQMFRASVIAEVGLLDDKIFFGPEDADFCIRIRAAGLKVVWLPNISIEHLWQRSTSGRHLSRRAWLHARGLLHFYFKHRRFF